MFNSSTNVYKTEWLDLVFKNRNQSYGAYVLRAESSKTLTRSLIISSALFMVVFASPMVYQKLFQKVAIETTKTTVFEVEPIHEIKKKEEVKKVKLAKALPAASKLKTISSPSNILVVEDTKMVPPTIDQTKLAVVANITQDGVVDPNANVSSILGKGEGGGIKGADDGSINGDPEAIIDASGVDEFPSFIGGEKAFAKYIQRNLSYPEMAQEARTMGKVFISFVIERDGSVSNVTLVRGIGSGCDEEAIRVLKKSPFWKPGKNNGQPVRVRYTLPINFQMSF
ncbi:energy transducer TonB [Pedobacter changchengzhani]|uniref:Energy transducer TonB n=1 Tax=Pedobacter changchengzhani TaxID=2529274 RepID=A0A4R5MMR8_9SPHI|nr:energy transducer TonB [Pedobacter changchengzhani]TDG36984.1 energy transducer TonB [Pedobacter changchengzhani]